MATTQGYAVAGDQGAALWMLGALFTVKASAPEQEE